VVLEKVAALQESEVILDKTKYVLLKNSSPNVTLKMEHAVLSYFEETTGAEPLSLLLRPNGFLSVESIDIVPSAVLNKRRSFGVSLPNIFRKSSMSNDITPLSTMVQGGAEPDEDEEELGVRYWANEEEDEDGHSQPYPAHELFTGISQIQTWLFLGNRFNAANKRELKRNKITNIINVTTHLPNHYQGYIGLTYSRVKVEDEECENLGVHFPAVTSYMESLRLKGERVFVHCSAGASRSPSIVLAYLIRYGSEEFKDMTLASAYDLVLDRRDIGPNLGFLRQLEKWEVETKGSSTLCELEAFKQNPEALMDPFIAPPTSTKSSGGCMIC